MGLELRELREEAAQRREARELSVAAVERGAHASDERDGVVELSVLHEQDGQVTLLEELARAVEERGLLLEAAALRLRGDRGEAALHRALVHLVERGADGVEQLEARSGLLAEPLERAERVEEGGGARADLVDEMLLDHVRVVAELLLEHLVEHHVVGGAGGPAVGARLEADRSELLLVPLGDHVERVRVAEVKVVRKEHLRHAAERREPLRRRRFGACCRLGVPLLAAGLCAEPELALALVPLVLRPDALQERVDHTPVRTRQRRQRRRAGADGLEARGARIDRRRAPRRMIEQRGDGCGQSSPSAALRTVEARERGVRLGAIGRVATLRHRRSLSHGLCQELIRAPAAAGAPVTCAPVPRAYLAPCLWPRSRWRRLTMIKRVPLFILDASLPGERTEKLLAEMRSSDYIAEITSTEVQPEQTELYDLVRVLEPAEQVDSVRGALRYARGLSPDAWDHGAVVLADERTARDDGSVLVVELDTQGVEVDQLRVTPRSLLEVVRRTSRQPKTDRQVANVVAHTTSLAQYRELSDYAPVFDSEPQFVPEAPGAQGTLP